MLITKQNCPGRWATISEWLVEHRQEELNSLSQGDQDLYREIYNADFEENSIPFPVVKMLSTTETGATFSVSPVSATWKAGYTIKTYDGTAPAAPTLSAYTVNSPITYAGDPGKHVVMAFTAEDANGVSAPVSFTKIYAPSVPTNLVVSDAGSVTFDSSEGAASYQIRYQIGEEPVVIVTSSSPYQIPAVKEDDEVTVSVRATNPGGSSEYSDEVIETII